MSTQTPTYAVLLLLFYVNNCLAQTLVWEDHFDGPALDQSNWGYQHGDGSDYGLYRWGNQEEQYYTDRAKNVLVSDGTLKLISHREDMGGLKYTSGRIRTAGKADWTYGRFEARMKIPAGKGTWPAFWMLPSNHTSGWPTDGEIDIMEHVGYNAGYIHGTIHTQAYNGMDETQQGGAAKISDYDTQWHLYAIEWDQDQIRWFVDNNQYYTYYNEGTEAAWPFHDDFYMILNLAIGGNWGGVGGIDNTIFPCTLEVDYVKVYAFDPVVHHIPGIIEAEDYYRMKGIQTETCTDEGGGLDIGYFSSGDWLSYLVNVEAAGQYQIDFRLATNYDNGQQFTLSDEVGILCVVDVPYTSGWQSWETVSHIVSLKGGSQLLKIETAHEGFNINYLGFYTNATDTNETNGMDDRAVYTTVIYPNPAGQHVTIRIGGNERLHRVWLLNAAGKVISHHDDILPGSTNLTIPAPPAQGVYFLKIQTDQQLLFRKLTKHNTD